MTKLNLQWMIWNYNLKLYMEVKLTAEYFINSPHSTDKTMSYIAWCDASINFIAKIVTILELRFMGSCFPAQQYRNVYTYISHKFVCFLSASKQFHWIIFIRYVLVYVYIYLHQHINSFIYRCQLIIFIWRSF